jgi:hypothetical protein
MPALTTVAFECTAKSSVVVRVTRHGYPAGDRPTWIVTVRRSTNVLLLRRFASLDRALDFAAEALSGRAA